MEEEHSRRYYSISQVGEMMDLKSHILRFWEKEFPQLRPRKNRAGNRAYTERDVKIVSLIKRLLYDERYTIEGAKQRLKADHSLIENQLSLPLDTVQAKKGIGDSEIKEIQQDLLELIEKIKAL